VAPPQAVKDKHVRLKVSPAANNGAYTNEDGAAPGKASSTSWRNNVTFKAMGWGLKESCESLQLLAGDRLDIAYTLGLNDHPEFGGLELTLRDVVRHDGRGSSVAKIEACEA
jgi:hypothetical protein